MELDNYYQSLTTSLKLMALPYNEQVASLPDFVDVKDEVLNSFFESFLLLPDLIEHHLLSTEAIASIIRVYNWMELTNSALNDLESFKNSDQWNKIRGLAKRSLLLMKENDGAPDLSSIQWVKA